MVPLGGCVCGALVVAGGVYRVVTGGVYLVVGLVVGGGVYRVVASFLHLGSLNAPVLD